jgi:hypothetical protein
LPPLWSIRLRWRAWSQSRPGRWTLAALPVLGLVLALTLMTFVMPGAVEVNEVWRLAGQIGVATATVVIGRAMLTIGRWM